MSDAVKVVVGDNVRPIHQSPPQHDVAALGGAPTRDRKMRAVSAGELEAARKLIQPIAPPRRVPRHKGNDAPVEVGSDDDRIVFPPDATPPDPQPPDPKSPLPISTRRRPRARLDIHYGGSPRQSAPAAAPSTADDPPPKFPPPELSDDEMAQVIALVQHKYGPILSLDQASELSKLAKQTLRERVSDGMYANSVVRGRPLRFWAHRFVQEVMK